MKLIDSEVTSAIRKLSRSLPPEQPKINMGTLAEPFKSMRMLPNDPQAGIFKLVMRENHLEITQTIPMVDAKTGRPLSAETFTLLVPIQPSSEEGPMAFSSSDRPGETGVKRFAQNALALIFWITSQKNAELKARVLREISDQPFEIVIRGKKITIVFTEPKENK